MGIKNLHKFLNLHITNQNCIKDISIKELENKVIAIDVSIFLYKFLCAIRNTTSELYGNNGQIITHIHATLQKVMSLLKHQIKPIFVFDGAAPEIKEFVLKDRALKKDAAKTELNMLIKKIKKLTKLINKTPETLKDVEDLATNFDEYVKLNNLYRKHLRTSTGISQKQTDECKEIMKLLGLPYFVADGEADPYCAELVKSNMAFAVSSEDMDLLTFGTKYLIRGLKSSGQCVIYDLKLILKELKITYEQFVDICILLGCDYTCTIKMLGIKTILKTIKQYGNIEEIIKSGKWDVPEEFDYVNARTQFFNTKRIPIEIKWLKPKYILLQNLLQNKYGYDKEEIDNIINVIKSSYYSVVCGDKTVEQFKQDKINYIKKKKMEITMDSDDDT